MSENLKYDELTASERLEVELSHLIRQTRIEGEGLPLKRVAEIIAEHFDPSETRSLAIYLGKIVS
jgi:hypothetical protein